MDGAAFLGALEAAKRIGLEALWLDAWCFRLAPGAEYVGSEAWRTVWDFQVYHFVTPGNMGQVGLCLLIILFLYPMLV